MRKTTLLVCLLALFSVGRAQPVINQVSFPDTATVFGLYEISFQMRDYDNPYDPEVIWVYAEFSGPDHQAFCVDGFYFEGYDFTNDHGVEIATRNSDSDGWKIRFTPPVAGEWRFTLHASDKSGETELTADGPNAFLFDCCEVDSAAGFITKRNTRFLKRTVIVDGKTREHAFFPIGPNVAWYSAADYGAYRKPYGVYDYEQYIQALSGNANYFRIWINRYQYLSIYGPEHAGTLDGKPLLYFDKSLNQKDSAELDYIFWYAAQHGIVIMPCIFNFRDFIHKQDDTFGSVSSPSKPSDWQCNPFHTVLGLESPYQFFTDREAIRITKNLLRYIVSRWGYATNLMGWELWNEVVNIERAQAMDQKIRQDIIDWHEEMSDYLSMMDPYQHLVSTSTGGSINSGGEIYSSVFETLDFVQDHNYQNIQKAVSKEQFSFVLYREAEKARQLYGSKPYFMGEFGFGQGSADPKLEDKDPWGVDMHNSLWSSAFSGAMGPASYWFWSYLKSRDLFGMYKPLLTFFEGFPLLSDSFHPMTTGSVVGNSLVFPNHLETYYMINVSEDTLMGWSQDTAFCYQSLRHLSDSVGWNGHFAKGAVNDPMGYVYTLEVSRRPQPSSTSNTITIPIQQQPVGTSYVVRWFDSETGLEMPSEAATAVVQRRWFRKYLSFEFPESIRDLRDHTVNNTFGDAVFMICKDQ